MEEQEQTAAVIAAEVETDASRLEAMEERLNALETALADLRTVAASAAPTQGGRRTVSVAASTQASAAAMLDGALLGLTPEQRIAVKSHMLRSGLL